MGNLASGEVFITPYEGRDSLTEGEWPIYDEQSGETIVCDVKSNVIRSVAGKESYALGLRRAIEENPERGNVAELGIGVNKEAVKRGVIIEDEKMKDSVHLAFGSGYTDSGSIISTDWHKDIVYHKHSEITVTVTLLYKDGSKEVLVKDCVLQVS